MLTINIIGCGNVGKTLAKIWYESHTLRIGNIINNSLESGLLAVDFIGSGTAISDYKQMNEADIFLISTSDNQISHCANILSEARITRPTDIVFHCSGSLTSDVLLPMKKNNAYIASIHPVQSFANPAILTTSFNGTYCSAEGDTEAVKILTEAFVNIGAQMIPINPSAKMIYHAATVIACNYVTTLLDVSQKCYERSGIPRDVSLDLIKPILLSTINNIFSFGTAKALTGPIARGDDTIIQKQLLALNEFDEDIATLYAVLGQYALSLSAEQGNASPEALRRISYMLDMYHRPRQSR